MIGDGSADKYDRFADVVAYPLKLKEALNRVVSKVKFMDIIIIIKLIIIIIYYNYISLVPLHWKRTAGCQIITCDVSSIINSRKTITNYET